MGNRVADELGLLAETNNGNERVPIPKGAINCKEGSSKLRYGVVMRYCTCRATIVAVTGSSSRGTVFEAYVASHPDLTVRLRRSRTRDTSEQLGSLVVVLHAVEMQHGPDRSWGRSQGL